LSLLVQVTVPPRCIVTLAGWNEKPLMATETVEGACVVATGV